MSYIYIDGIAQVMVAIVAQAGQMYFHELIVRKNAAIECRLC